MIRIAIVDDEVLLLNRTKRFIEHHLMKSKVAHEITLYNKSKLLLYDLHDNVYFDIFILDIEMPHLNGMDLVKEIRKYLKTSLVIFLTSHEKYAAEAFELTVFRYIPKINLEYKLGPALNDAINQIELESKECYIISNRSRFEKLPIKEIVYLYKEDKNTVFVTTSGSTRERKSLYKVFECLDPEEFILTDRGYIVNISHVMKVTGHEVMMSDGSRVSISRANLQETKSRISNFWRTRLVNNINR